MRSVVSCCDSVVPDCDNVIGDEYESVGCSVVFSVAIAAVSVTEKVHWVGADCAYHASREGTPSVKAYESAELSSCFLGSFVALVTYSVSSCWVMPGVLS